MENSRLYDGMIEKGKYEDVPWELLKAELRRMENNLKAMEVFPKPEGSEETIKSTEDDLTFKIYKIRREFKRRRRMNPKREMIVRK